MPSYFVTIRLSGTFEGSITAASQKAIRARIVEALDYIGPSWEITTPDGQFLHVTTDDVEFEIRKVETNRRR